MTRGARTLAVAALVLARPAFADVTLETQVTARRVEVNQPFRVQLKAMSDGQSNPANPRLPVPDVFRIQAPSLGTQTEVQILNNRMVQRVGITATWTLVAIKPGKYRLGPASIAIDGQRKQDEAFQIQVEPEGTLQRRAPGGIPGRVPFDPFDMFDPFGRQPFPRFPFGEPEEEPQQAPEFPPEYAVDRLRDATAFVVGKVKPQRVVLGQGLDFGVYAYGAQGFFEAFAITEPSREGFIAYQVELDQPRRAQGTVGGQSVIAQKVLELVFFPIRTGALRIGSSRVLFRGRGYASTTNPLGLERENPPIEVTVVEPPLLGRPVGYRIGDVGRYTLSASISQKSVRQGEAISVVARLEGVGNVPTKLNLPQQNGVEWMEPTTSEKLEVGNANVRGQRTFTYVVRFDRTGRIDLGEVSLPYYDADRQRYEIARATLGAVEVAPNPGAANSGAAAPPTDRLQGILHPRKTLRPVASSRAPFTERNGFWAVLIGGPLGILSLGGALRAGKRWRERWVVERATPRRRALEELDAARRTAANGQVAATAASLERALHFALESATGVRARGVLRTELPRSLAARGISEELGHRIVSLLEASELARFAEGGTEGQAEDLRARGEEVVRAVLRAKS